MVYWQKSSANNASPSGQYGLPLSPELGLLEEGDDKADAFVTVDEVVVMVFIDVAALGKTVSAASPAVVREGTVVLDVTSTVRVKLATVSVPSSLQIGLTLTKSGTAFSMQVPG